jgi:glucokinase
VTSGPALLADVGGTHTRLTVLAGGAESHPCVLDNAAHEGLAPLIESYLGTLPAALRPQRGALAVAAPIGGDEVVMTNRGWRFSIAALAARLGLDPLPVINDFTAVALAVPHLAAGECLDFGGGGAVSQSPIAVLGPGTGLGVSGLIPNAQGWAAIAGEGGHVTLAPANDAEAEVLRELRRRYGHVSAERVLSGPGLVDLYRLLAAPAAVADPAEVTALALKGGDPAAAKALELFFSFLGNVAGNLALTLGARGGVYLAGGILPRLAGALAASAFRERFEAKGRYRPYLAAIPTRLIVAPAPAWRGLATLL